MARAPVSKTGGWGFESLHSCHPDFFLYFQLLSKKVGQSGSIIFAYLDGRSMPISEFLVDFPWFLRSSFSKLTVRCWTRTPNI
jgi:hypothetical protein